MTECTPSPAAAASAILEKIVALLAPQLERMQNRLEQFRQQPVTPAAFFELETHLQADLREVGRRLLEQLLSQLEPATAKQAEPRVGFRGEAYRRPFKQPKTFYSTFGPLNYARLRYEACERGEPSLFPLDWQLGLEAHLATPALAEHVGRLAVQHEQRQVLAILWDKHEVCWSVDTLRKVTVSLHDGMASFREPAQIAKFLHWLEQASSSRGRHRPVLAVGRDGIMPRVHDTVCNHAAR